MKLDQIIALISAFGVGTIFSTILSLFSEGKKINVGQITNQRSTWRDKIDKNLSSVSRLIKKYKFEKNFSYVSRYTQKYEYQIIESVKDLVTAYGMNENVIRMEFYINNGHTWYLLQQIEENMDDVDLKIQQLTLLQHYLRQLKKRDWEFSKNEVKFAIARGLLVSVRIILSILSVINVLGAILIDHHGGYVTFLLISSLFHCAISISLGNFIASYNDKNRYKRESWKYLRRIPKLYLHFFGVGILYTRGASWSKNLNYNTKQLFQFQLESLLTI